MVSLTDTRWLVTGCSTGFGRSLAQHLLAQGAQVLVTARRRENLTAFEGVKGAWLEALDVNEDTQIAALAAAVQQRWGGLEVLVNNAGYGLMGALEELEMSQIRAQMETNFFGLVALTQAVLPMMRRQQRGYIVNLSSIAGLRGFRGMSLYNASKFAVTGLSEALAQELTPLGIRVSVVEPGPYRTDWAGRSLDRSLAIRAADPASPYQELNQALVAMMADADGQQPGDPLQIAEVIASCAQLALAGEAVPVHLIMGDEARQYWQDKLRRMENPKFLDVFPHGRRSL